jgi:F0F1-type ATP synthase assembly protein I
VVPLRKPRPPFVTECLHVRSATGESDNMSAGSDHPSGDDKPQLTALTFAQLGMVNAASLLVGFGIGWLGDTRLGTAPIFIFVGLLVGAGCGVYATYRRIRRYL